MNANETSIRERCAKSDMAKARRNGRVLICETTRGLVELAHAGGVYTVTTQGLGSTVLAQGAPRAVAPTLASLYVLVFE